MNVAFFINYLFLMGNFLKSKRSGMVGFYVPDRLSADKLVEFFSEKGTNLAWIDENPVYVKNKVEVLVPENELERLALRATDVSIEFRNLGHDVSWPSIYGNPHFTYL